MTLVSRHHHLAALSADEFRSRLSEALQIYVLAMRYPPGTAEQRAPMWLTHVLREGWRCIAAFDEDDTMLGIAYGYRGRPGQWWHEQVRRGVAQAPTQPEHRWLDEYFELTEIHVRPDQQGRGIGEELLRELLAGVPDAPRVLLSTPEGTSRAWKLYRRLGFVDVLRSYRFAGDPRPFAILGCPLPLP